MFYVISFLGLIIGLILSRRFKDELKDFSLASGTIRFTTEKPIPEALLKKIIQARMKDNLNKSKK